VEESHVQIRSNVVGELVIIDGYNVCGYWKKLKRHFVKGDIETSRTLLLDELSALREENVMVVFDASQKPSTSNAHKIAISDTLTQVFVSDADEFIDREVSRRENANLDICVVTSDNLTRSLAATGGARLMSSKAFVEYLDKVKARDKSATKLLDFEYQYRGSLGFALDGTSRSDLLELKDTLPVSIESPSDGIERQRDAAKGSLPGQKQTKGNENRKRRNKTQRRKAIIAEQKKKTESFKSIQLASENPFSNLGASADKKLSELRANLDPPSPSSSGEKE